MNFYKLLYQSQRHITVFNISSAHRPLHQLPLPGNGGCCRAEKQKLILSTCQTRFSLPDTCLHGKKGMKQSSGQITHATLTSFLSIKITCFCQAFFEVMSSKALYQKNVSFMQKVLFYKKQYTCNRARSIHEKLKLLQMVMAISLLLLYG